MSFVPLVPLVPLVQDDQKNSPSVESVESPSDEEWISLSANEENDSQKDKSSESDMPKNSGVHSVHSVNTTETNMQKNKSDVDNLEIKTQLTEEKNIQVKLEQKEIQQEEKTKKCSIRWCHVFTRLGVCAYGESCRFRHMKTFEERQQALRYVSKLYKRCPPCKRGHCPNLVSSFGTKKRFCSCCQGLIQHSRYVLQKVFI